MISVFTSLREMLALTVDIAKLFCRWISAFFTPRHELAAEIIALRSQLALYQLQQQKGMIPKPRCTPGFRLTWVLLSKIFSGWKEALCVVKPETVIRWHRAGFRLFWRQKSRHKAGRPRVSVEMRRLTRKIAAENPLWSPERVHDQLLNLGFHPPSSNTIRKYLPKPNRGDGTSSQTWKTFVSNHLDVTWSMDLFVVPTITFKLLYVFIVVSHDRRRIVHFGITRHPTMAWVTQQLREATVFGVQPNYVIRDNDSIYGATVREFLKNSGIKDVRTSFRSPWQNGICERLVGILRQELLDHIIPLNERHLHRLLTEYIDRYYHSVRTHSSLGREPPDADPSITKRQLSPEAHLESEPILGGLYRTYRTKAV